MRHLTRAEKKLTAENAMVLAQLLCVVCPGSSSVLYATLQTVAQAYFITSSDDVGVFGGEPDDHSRVERLTQILDEMEVPE